MSTYFLVLLTIYVGCSVVLMVERVWYLIISLNREKKEVIGWQMHKNNVSAQEQSIQISNAVSLEDRITLEKLTIENRMLREQRDNKYLSKEEDTNDK